MRECTSIFGVALAMRSAHGFSFSLAALSVLAYIHLDEKKKLGLLREHFTRCLCDWFLQDGDWVVGPTRYPHSCDIRALALISATPDVSGASGSRGPSRHTSHNFTFVGEGASLIAVTGAVDGSICFNERLMGLAVSELFSTPIPTCCSCPDCFSGFDDACA